MLFYIFISPIIIINVPNTTHTIINASVIIYIANHNNIYLLTHIYIYSTPKNTTEHLKILPNTQN